MPKRITTKEIDRGSISSSIKDGGEKLVTAELLKTSIVSNFDEGDENKFASSKLTKELKKELTDIKRDGLGGYVVIPEGEDIPVEERKSGMMYLKVTDQIREAGSGDYFDPNITLDPSAEEIVGLNAGMRAVIED